MHRLHTHEHMHPLFPLELFCMEMGRAVGTEVWCCSPTPPEGKAGGWFVSSRSAYRPWIDQPFKELPNTGGLIRAHRSRLCRGRSLANACPRLVRLFEVLNEWTGQSILFCGQEGENVQTFSEPPSDQSNPGTCREFGIVIFAPSRPIRTKHKHP